METVADLLSDDVVFHVPGTGANAGDHRSREEVFAFIEQAARLTGGTLRFRLHDVLVGDKYAAAVATYRATRPNRAPLENNLDQLIRVEDGRVVERNNHDNAANKPARTGDVRSLLTYQHTLE